MSLSSLFQVTSFTVYTKSSESAFAQLVVYDQPMPPGTMNFTVPDLRPGFLYEFKIITHGAGGRSTPSAPTGQVLMGFGPPPQVLLPNARLRGNDVVLVWRRPSESLSGEITGYTVYAKRDRKTTSTVLEVTPNELSPVTCIFEDKSLCANGTAVNLEEVTFSSYVGSIFTNVLNISGEKPVGSVHSVAQRPSCWLLPLSGATL